MGKQALKRWTAAIALAFCFAPAVKAQDIVLGQIGPFTVIPSTDAVEVNQGIKAYIAQANRAGGLRGHNLSFFELDDRYSVEGFAEQFPKAMERKPVALLTPIGSAALTKALAVKLFERADIVVVNAIPGAESLRSPGSRMLFHIRAGDKQQIEKFVTNARTIGMTRMAVLYQDLPVGTSGMAVAQQAVGQGNLELKGVKSAGDAPAMAAAAQQVARLGSQGVLIIGPPRFMADGVAALRKAGVSQTLFVLSYVTPELVVKLAGLQGARGVVIAQTFPNPNAKNMPLQRDFQTAMKSEYPQMQEYSPLQLEGYISARVVVEAFKRSKDREFTSATLARALPAAGEIDLGGFRVNFSEGNVGSQFVDIGVIGADGKLRY